MNPVWLFAWLAVALDAAVAVAVTGAVDRAELLACAGVHGLTCLLFALCFAHRLAAYGPQRRDAAVLGLTLACVLPVLGMLGLLLLVAPALGRRTEPASVTAWRCLPLPELPLSAPRSRGRNGISGARNLDAILRNAPGFSTRMDAVMRTVQLPDVQAAGLLRKALKDPNEEVRLLAYALLNRKERAVEARIHGLRMGLDTAAPAQRLVQQRTLAYVYWELYLLSAQPVASASPLLAYVCEYARAALRQKADDAGLHFLLGRALLRQRQWKAAQQAFRHAEHAGMAVRLTHSYRAEIAFMRRHERTRQAGQRPSAGSTHLEPVRPSLHALDHGVASA